MTVLDVSRAKERLSGAGKLAVSESFELAKVCSRLLGDTKSESLARDLIIRALEASENLPVETRSLWNDLVLAAGLHPYTGRERVSAREAIFHEYHRSQYLTDYYLHREQQELSALLLEGQSLVLSAPTSFGKSLLIEEIVASGRYDNIVVVQPTLALLDETRKKFSKYGDKYHIVVSTHQAPGAGSNLFLFTAERVVEYEKLPPVDFFVIDEFYKLSLDRDDERAITLNQALYVLLRHTRRFYLLGPNIKHISATLTEEYGAVWRHSEYATVSVDVEQVFKGKAWKKHDERRKSELFRLLCTLTEPTIIYCASPQKANDLAKGFIEYLAGVSLSKEWMAAGAGNTEVIEWINENIHERWILGAALRYAVGVHHGHLPRHLGSSIVDAFNNRSIRSLFCTATLIEGVNTAARNVVLYDQHKGRKPIDFFDYKNIVGRSGRMKVHYVGKVFEFHKEPSQAELEVDVPLFSQRNAPLELLVQLSPEDLQPEAQARLSEFETLDPELQKLIKKNSGIPVLGQVALIREITENRRYYYPLLRWTSYPTYEELEAVLDLCWRFLLKPTESKANVRSHKQLTVMTRQYCHGKSLQSLIAQSLASPYWTDQEPDLDERVQKVVSLVLGVARQWFDYKLPKLLTAVSDLQSFVFGRVNLKPGNYSYLAASLENSFFKGVLSVLLDYDVPASAVRKMERLFSGQEEWAAVEERLRSVSLERLGLMPYERAKVQAALGTARDRRKK